MRLLHRVFAIEVLVCDRCGGPRRILGAVTDPPAVRRVLVALGLAAKPPPGRSAPPKQSHNLEPVLLKPSPEYQLALGFHRSRLL